MKLNDEINYMLSYIASRTDDVLADDYIGKTQDYITNLQERIDKAIEYINKYEVITGYYDGCYDGEYDTYSNGYVKENLLEILERVNEE